MFPTLVLTFMALLKVRRWSVLYLSSIFTISIVLFGPFITQWSWAFPKSYYEVNALSTVALLFATLGVLVSYPLWHRLNVWSSLVHLFPPTTLCLFLFSNSLEEYTPAILAAMNLVALVALLFNARYEWTPNGYAPKQDQGTIKLKPRPEYLPPENSAEDRHRNWILFGSSSVPKVELSHLIVCLICVVICLFLGTSASYLANELSSVPFHGNGRSPVAAYTFALCVPTALSCFGGALLLLCHSCSLLVQIGLQSLREKNLKQLWSWLMHPSLIKTLTVGLFLSALSLYVLCRH